MSRFDRRVHSQQVRPRCDIRDYRIRTLQHIRLSFYLPDTRIDIGLFDKTVLRFFPQQGKRVHHFVHGLIDRSNADDHLFDGSRSLGHTARLILNHALKRIDIGCDFIDRTDSLFDARLLLVHLSVYIFDIRDDFGDGTRRIVRTAGHIFPGRNERRFAFFYVFNNRIQFSDEFIKSRNERTDFVVRRNIELDGEIGVSLRKSRKRLRHSLKRAHKQTENTVCNNGNEDDEQYDDRRNNLKHPKTDRSYKFRAR